MTYKNKWKNPSGTRTYYCWRNMRHRCLKTDSIGYHHYGAKGITICDRWINDYDAFFDDMGECPKGKTLDRINSAGNYEPSNCRWATMKEQQNNRSDNVFITYEGKILSFSCWAEELGIKKTTLFRRLFVAKMPVKLAFSKKVSHRTNNGNYCKWIKKPVKTSLFCAGDKLMFE